MQEILETDEVGRPVATYVVSGGAKANEQSQRIDIISPSSLATPWTQRLLSVFLPSGYPHTVSSDYTAYQIYDSLQAFSSSIAGLLASRAVLQGIGVGDEHASATTAMLLNVLQESMGRGATILFAHLYSGRIEAECKKYRLAADIFNDTAMVVDCLSPMFAKPIRVPLLGASSVFRAMCGVAGGSSKAILSSHFARADNIGELNAKDSSQETVISLLGMWAGGFVVSRMTSSLATWWWLLSLLAIHLGTNYAAVTSVHMRTLNRQRCNIVFSALLAEGRTLSPEEAAKQEFVFETENVLRWRGSEVIGTCHIGASLGHLLQRMEASSTSSSGSINRGNVELQQVLDLFTREDYVLWFDPHSKSAAIVLKRQATTKAGLKAWSHAIRIAWTWRIMTQSPAADRDAFSVLETTLQTHNQAFDQQIKQLEAVGWNVATAALETTPGRRLEAAR